MALARFSDEQRINDLLGKHGLSVSFLAALAGHAHIYRASYPTIAAGLAGKGLRIETSQALLELMKELDSLTEAMKPLRLDFSNASEVYGWLLLLREGRLKFFVIDDEPNLGRGHEG